VPVIGSRPTDVHVRPDPHPIDEPDGVLQRRLAREQECLGAEAVANRAQAGAVGFGVRQPP